MSNPRTNSFASIVKTQSKLPSKEKCLESKTKKSSSTHRVCLYRSCDLRTSCFPLATMRERECESLVGIVYLCVKG